MISQIQAAVAAVVANKKPVVDAALNSDPKPVDKAATTATDKATFSTLAAQLNESAARAQKRDAVMTHTELGQYGRNRINEFLIEGRTVNSGTRAMEVPKTNDPELLDRAREASAFVTRTLAGDKTAKSPFENLSREQLNLIAFDDSGDFTPERAARGLAGRAEDGRGLAQGGDKRGGDRASPNGEGHPVLQRRPELPQVAAGD